MRAIDIETVPNMNTVDSLPEVKAPGNLKDPAKIEAAIAEKKAEQISKMALNPLYARICSVAWWGDGPEDHGYLTMDKVDEAEEICIIKKCLEFFTFENRTAPSILTWNGYNFDIPFIFMRAMLLNIERPTAMPGLRYFCKKYSYVPHCDLMQELVNWDQSKHISLDSASKIFLGEKKLDHDFTKFIELIETGRSFEIGIYNLRDAELTYRIANKAACYLW